MYVSFCRFEDTRMHLALGFYWHGKDKTTMLYPYTNDDIVFFAPMEYRSAESFDLMKNSLYLCLFNLYWIVAIPISLMRVLVERWFHSSTGQRNPRNAAYIYMHTCCTLIGNSMPFRAATSADRCLVQTLATAAILLDTCMASYLFGIFAGRHAVSWRFDRIDDIRAANLTVCMMDVHAEYGRDLRTQGLFVREMNTFRYMESMAVGDRCAYMLSRSYISSFNTNQKLHEMKENMGIRHMAGIIPHYSGLEERLNVLMQRIVEHGLLTYLKGLNGRLEYTKYRQDMLQLKPDVESLAKDSMPGALLWLWVYLGFCGCCALVCCVEIGLASK